jgi:hypothetical protein
MHHLVKYRYVHRDVDRHGNTRIYFRRAMGQPKFRLPGEPGSPEFNARYEALLRGEADLKPSVAASERAAAGTTPVRRLIGASAWTCQCGRRKTQWPSTCKPSCACPMPLPAINA